VAHQAKKANDQLPKPAGQQSERDGVREYFEQAMLANQPRLTDLIPKSLWAYLAMLLMGVISIYVCQQGFIHTRDLEDSGFPVQLFNTTGPGNIASWCLSVMLLLLSVGAVLVYLLRRHKADDYKGRYRLWLHLVVFSGLLSFDAATGAHQILAVPAAQLPGLWNEASVWWMMLVLLGSIYFSVRLLIEFKSRPGMLMMLSMAVMVLIAAGCSRLGSVIGESDLTTDVAQSSLLMSATLIVCLMTWLNARSVYVVAQRGRMVAEEPVVTETVTVAKQTAVLTEAEDQQQTVVEQDVEWDDWGELEEEPEESEEQYVDYAEEELDELDDLDYPEQQDQQVVYEEVEYEADDENEVVEQQEEIIYSAYASEPVASHQPNPMTVYETPADDSQENGLFIPSHDDKIELEPFDEDAFWEQYDLTKMSRKQLKTMRKKLNRLKRKHAERQRAA
tara:strand:+ start:668 stop:2011 length:1344 start_codon:yes stop_codon:yes gene_type:complete